MANRSRFVRKYIMLDDVSKNYTKVKNSSKGYVKMEIRDGKGKLVFNVEGLDRINDKIYKGYLLTKTQDKFVKVDVGTILIDENGRGSLEWRFNRDSVGGTGISIEDFNVVLIKLSSVDVSDSTRVVPLAGYIHKNDGTINNFIKEFIDDSIYSNKASEEKVNSNSKMLELDSEVEDVKDISKEKDLTIEIDNNKVEELSDSEIEKQEQLNEDIETDKEQETLESFETEEAEDESPEINSEDESVDDQISEDLQQENYQEIEVKNEELREEVETQNEDLDKDKDGEYKLINNDKDDYFVKNDYKKDSNTNTFENIKYEYGLNQREYGHSVNKGYGYSESIMNYSNQVANYTLNILKYFEKVKPLKDEPEGYEWWKIEYDSRSIYRGFLPFYNYIINMYSPYPLMTKVTSCQELIKKYNHYIFGIKKEGEKVKYYVYGVPGKFTINEQPYRGTTGFQTWLEKGDKKGEGLGYWLIHIDAVSGRIVTPLRPTPPRR